MNSIGRIAGFDIVIDINMIDYHTRTIKRSWAERLFTLPWKPLNDTKEEIYTTQKESVLILPNENTMVMHPDLAKRSLSEQC